MGRHLLRTWLKAFQPRRRAPVRRPLQSRLSVERFEDRTVPSSTILLNQFGQTPNWTPIGPGPQTTPGELAVTGRVSGIAVDPTNPDRIFVTAASGGVWRTLDGGFTWTPLTLHLPDNTNTLPNNTPITAAQRTLNMGAIAIAPSDPNVIYAAEGEGDTFQNQGSVGHGVLVSRDGGDTWVLTGTDVFDGAAPISAHSIVVDSLDPNIAFVGNLDGGVFRTLDGGQTWQNITAASPLLAGVTLFTDVDLAPRLTFAEPLVLYTTVGDGSLASGIYRSINPDAADPTTVTWNLSIGGSTLVPGAGPGNIQLTMSRQFPSILYAGIATIAGTLLGVYRTTDSGVNWTRILNTPNYLGNQADYDNTIAVSPFNPNVVIVGGQTELLFSNNAAGPNPTFSSIANVGGLGPHVDHHAAVFDSEGNFLDGDDGGLYKLTLANFTTPLFWQSLNGNSLANPVMTALNTIQFNSISLHPRSADIALGGSQDNGVGLFRDNVGWTGTDTTADGGVVIFDYDNPLHAVHSTQFNASAVRYSDDGGVTWTLSNPQPPNTQFNPPDGLFYEPIIIDPSASNRYFFGSDEISISEDGGRSWGTTYTFANGTTQNIPGDPSTDIPAAMGGPFPISAIGVGRASSFVAIIYAAHVDGTLYQLIVGPPPPAVTQDDWINIAPTGAASVGVISQIIVDPQDPQILYVVGPGGISRTKNALAFVPTWQKISGSPATGGLPSFFSPVTIALDTKNISNASDDVLYVGGDYGVYQLDDPGHAGPGQPGGQPFVWTQVGGSYDPATGKGLPDVKVASLLVNSTTGILAAGTYGAGLWEIQIRGLIRGEVYEDLNGNGQFETGEPGVAGLIVRLLNNDNPAAPFEIASAFTDSRGIYEFRSLTASQLTANNYLMVLGPTSGLIQTTTTVSLNATLDENSTYDISDPTLDPSQVNLAIGVFRPGSISGTKFQDTNGDGIRNPGEPGLGGVTIFVDANNNNVLDTGEQSTTTLANGRFLLSNLGPAVVGGLPNPATFNGTYLIREVQQPGFTQTTPPLAPITLNSNQNITGKLIGNRPLPSIAGIAFLDRDGDGIKDTGEVGFGGITIQLDGPGGPFTVTSAADGSFIFRGLTPGTYQLSEPAQPGLTQTTPNPGPITLGANDNLVGFLFGNFQNVTVNGTKFDDANGNGVRDGGEGGLAGFTFQLVNAANGAVVGFALSDSSGAYSFTDVGPQPGGGAYTVREQAQLGWVQTTPNPANFTPTSGVDVTVSGIGNFRAYAVTGTSYADLNGNGARDGGEPGISGYTIQARDAGGAVVTQTVTAADGTYGLTLGPGSYTIVEVARPLFTTTQGAAGYPVTAVSGGSAPGTDFGNRPRAVVVAGRDAGGPPTVTVRDPSTNQVINTITAYGGGFPGGVRVAVGDINGDFIPDIVTGPGPGGGPHIRVFDGVTGSVIREFFAFTPAFTGGVYVSTGDVDGDGRADIVIGAGEGGGPHVRVFRGTDNAMIREFYAYSPEFRVGVRVATGDFNKDGRADIVTGAGPGGGPHVQVFSGIDGAVLKSFYAYGATFTAGIYVAAGDVNGDTVPDIITGPGSGGGPHLRVFNGALGGVLSETYAFPPAGWSSGLRVGAGDVNGDGRADVIVGAGPGQSPRVRAVDGVTLIDLLPPPGTITVFDPGFLGGIFVA